MTLKIRKGSNVYFQSHVSGFGINNKGVLSMDINDKSHEVECDFVTFWSSSDDYQDDEFYIGLIPIR